MLPPTSLRPSWRRTSRASLSVAARSLTSAHTITLFLPFLSQQSVTDDILDSMNIVETLLVDQIHQVVITAVRQEIFDVLGCVCATILILNLGRSHVPIQSQQEVAHVFSLTELRRVIPRSRGLIEQRTVVVNERFAEQALLLLCFLR